MASQTWFATDADRRERYLKLRALGYANATARKNTAPNTRSLGDTILSGNRRSGASRDISIPQDESMSIEDKVRIALALIGEHRLRMLGDTRPSLEAELIGEAKQVSDSGGDVDRYIENRVNALRKEARAVRTSMPLERSIETSRGRVVRELPSHEVSSEQRRFEDEQAILENFEEYAHGMIRVDYPDISEDIAGLIVAKALKDIKALMNQGVRLTRERSLDLAQGIVKTINAEVSKLKEGHAVMDNPSKTYYLSSTNTDRFPYKKVEGRATFVQLMMIASRAAKSMGAEKPKNLKSAIRTLDKAGFRVGEVK